MPESTTIRETTAAEREVIFQLCERAFPEENLLPLIADLLDSDADVLSLGCLKNGSVIGHGMFTWLGDGRALLGPLGIDPAHQRSGIGSALVRDGLSRLANEGVYQVFVLGDPRYYSRFGFASEGVIEPPYALPPEWADAWQSVALADGHPKTPSVLAVPKPWRNQALWSG